MRIKKKKQTVETKHTVETRSDSDGRVVVIMNWSSPRIVESLEEPEGTDDGKRSRSPRQMSQMVGRLSPRIPRFSPNNSGPVSRPNSKDSAMKVQERDKTHKGANDSIAHMPQLDLRSLSKDHQLEAPLTVDRLMGFLRCRSTPRNESEVFKEFEEEVKELIKRNAKASSDFSHLGLLRQRHHPGRLFECNAAQRSTSIWRIGVGAVVHVLRRSAAAGCAGLD